MKLEDTINQVEIKIRRHPYVQRVNQQYDWKAIDKKLPSKESITPYSKIPQEVRLILSDIQDRYGREAYYKYNKLLLLKVMLQSASDDSIRRMPVRIVKEWEKWCRRLLLDMEKADETSFSFENDFFLKDLAVCRLKMIPAVCHLLEMLGLEKKLMFRGNLKQFVHMGLMVASGNYKPYFQTHVDLRYLKEFHPSGRKKCFLAASELISNTPQVKGLFSSSWYNDPALDRISPHLAYLRTYPLENGAALFKVGSSKQDVVNSTQKSRTRKRLYECGKYVPTCYMWVWPKSKLNRWAKSQNE